MNFYFLTFVAILVLISTKNTLEISNSVLISLLSIIILMMIIYRIKFESFITINSKTQKKIGKLIDNNEKESSNLGEIIKKISNTHKGSKLKYLFIL